MSLAHQPSPTRFAALIGSIAVAGLVAGLLASVFHAVATEPIIDEAIALEQLHHGEEEASDPVVPREVQKVGLFVGWLILGVAYAALLGVVYAIARMHGWLGPSLIGPMLLAAVAYLGIALFPALKYPANPPGVGDPETIGFRQLTFVASWVVATGPGPRTPLRKATVCCCMS